MSPVSIQPAASVTDPSPITLGRRVSLRTQMLPDATVSGQRILKRFDGYGADLSGAVIALHRNAKPGLELFAPTVRQWCGTAGSQGGRRSQCTYLVAGIEQHPNHRRYKVERFDVPLADEFGVADGLEPGHDQQRPSSPQRRKQTVDRAGVVHRAGVDSHRAARRGGTR